MGPALFAGVCEVLSSEKLSGLGSSHRNAWTIHTGEPPERKDNMLLGPPSEWSWEVTVSVTLSLIRKVLSHDVWFLSSDSSLTSNFFSGLLTSLVVLHEENPQITSGQQGRETLGWDSRQPKTTPELQCGHLHHVPGQKGVHSREESP